MGLNKPITHINPLDPSTALRMTPLFDQTKTQAIQLPPSEREGDRLRWKEPTTNESAFAYNIRPHGIRAIRESPLRV